MRARIVNRVRTLLPRSGPRLSDTITSHSYLQRLAMVRTDMPHPRSCSLISSLTGQLSFLINISIFSQLYCLSLAQALMHGAESRPAGHSQGKLNGGLFKTKQG